MRYVDVSDDIETGLIRFLSSQPRLNQFLPASRIFASQVPSDPGYPYFRYGTPIISPFNASCWDGTTVRATMDVFAQSDGEVQGQKQCGQIAALIIEAMNGLRLPGLKLVRNEFLGHRKMIVDSESDRWRSMIEYEITAVLA